MKRILVALFLSLYALAFLCPIALADETTPMLRSDQTLAFSPPLQKKIIISLSLEQLTAYDGTKIVLQTPITSGGPGTPTPTGTFQILEKDTNFVMHSPWPQTDWRWYPDSLVNYALLFDTNGFYIHDASWRSNFGVGSNSQIGTPGGDFTGTHGCINVPLSAEALLYSWATIGTPVIIGS